MADLMPGLLRDDQRDAPPVRGRPAGMGCPIGQNHVTLAPASLGIGLAAMVVDQSLGVGVREPFGLAAPAQPRKHLKPLSRTRSIAA